MPYVAGSLNYANTRALRFTSDADRVVVADPSGSFTYTGAFTFEAVIRTTSSSTTAAILAKNGTGDGEGEYWWRLPGAAGGTQRLGLNSQAFVAGTNRLNDGAWHHVAAVYDQGAAEVRLYADYMLDGVMSGVTFDRPVGRPADLQIGSFIGGGSEFEGDIDFIRISDGALSPGEFVQRTVPLGPVVKLLLPAPGARSVAPQPLIQAEIQNRDLAVVLGSLRLFLDGNEVTASSIKSGDDAGAKIAYTPALALANGLHAAVMTYNDNAAPAGSWTNTWSFTVVGSVPVLALFQFDEGTPGNFADTTAGAILGCQRVRAPRHGQRGPACTWPAARLSAILRRCSLRSVEARWRYPTPPPVHSISRRSRASHWKPLSDCRHRREQRGMHHGQAGRQSGGMVVAH